MKSLQVKGAAKEGVIASQEKRIKNLTDEQAQYKEALRTLNKEVKDLKEKLEEEGRQRKKDLKAKETAEKELTALQGQVEIAKADVVKEFKESQAFIDSCVEYYGTRFEDCLKQVTSSFPELDLSEISMDDPIPTTPASDIVVDEDDDFTELDPPPKNDGVVLA